MSPEELDTKNISLKSDNVYQGINGGAGAEGITRSGSSLGVGTLHCASLRSFVHIEPGTELLSRDLGLGTATFLVISTEPGLHFPPGKCTSFCIALLLVFSTEPSIRFLWVSTWQQHCPVPWAQQSAWSQLIGGRSLVYCCFSYARH